MKKSDYTYRIDGNILFIEDLNLGRMSVTNDIENVISNINTELKRDHGTPISNFKVIYKDSEGDIDEVVLDGEKFFAFHILGARDFHAAKLKIKS